MHTAELYSYMRELCPKGIVVGIDEVGRGAVAGPLTVACVALADKPQIIGLDDSKKITPKRREVLAQQIKEQAIAHTVVHIAPEHIDAHGMARSLRKAMTDALEACAQMLADAAQAPIEAVLIDGNPMHIHPAEQCIVKGDAKVACIAAASIVAKVSRDALMCELANEYPAYSFDSNKGYGSAAHMAAIKESGPSSVHRRSFLGNVLAEQQTLL